MKPITTFDLKTISVKLRSKAERMVKKNHPWIFEDSIIKQNTQANLGDTVVIYDSRKNRFLACGLYDSNSPIKIKVLQFLKPKKIDQLFFQERVDEAFSKRAELLETDTNSYRLLYGEADHFPGFIADVYTTVLVVKLYSGIWFPYLQMIIHELQRVSGCETVVLRLSRNLQKIANQHNYSDGDVLVGSLKSNVVVFKEHGVNFSANVIHGHKTGYFLDHRENRRRVGVLAKNKTVLDVFSYAGGFSVHALAGGARAVTSLDISEQALQMALSNGKLNDYPGEHNIIAGDAFTALQRLVRQKIKYDIVVIDPPSFAKSSKEIDKAKHSYGRLARLGAQLVANKGILILASCSSRVVASEFFSICEAEIQNASKSFQLLETTYHDTDHPVIDSFPEGAYLKCAYYQMR